MRSRGAVAIGRSHIPGDRLVEAVAEAPIEATPKLTGVPIVAASIQVAYLPGEVVEGCSVVKLASVGCERLRKLIRTLGPNRQGKADLRRENIGESGHVVSRRDERRTQKWVRL